MEKTIVRNRQEGKGKSSKSESTNSKLSSDEINRTKLTEQGTIFNEEVNSVNRELVDSEWIKIFIKCNNL